MVRTIATGIDIAAPRWRVWQMLTEVDGYPTWNPFITSIDGASPCRLSAPRPDRRLIPAGARP